MGWFNHQLESSFLKPWEDLVYGHGKKIMEGHVAFQSGIASWDWRLGWGLGLFSRQMEEDLERYVGVIQCFLLFWF